MTELYKFWININIGNNMYAQVNNFILDHVSYNFLHIKATLNDLNKKFIVT